MKIVVLGAGAWGTALAVSAGCNPLAQHSVTLWARDAGQASSMQVGRENVRYLPGITLLGHQSRAALDALFAGADVFVMPSLVEGFGLVYLEALAAGCHVIGTTNTGLPDMSLSQEAATIVAPGDPGMLADALSAIALRKRLRKIDPTTIRAEGARWSWSDFRHQIASHAAQVYGQTVGS